MAAAVWAGVFGMGTGLFGVGCGAKRKSQRSAHPGGAKPRPYYIIERAGVFLCRGLNLLLVGACMAGPPTVRGCIFGVVGAARAGVFGVGCGAKRKGRRSANPGGASPAPTI